MDYVSFQKFIFILFVMVAYQRIRFTVKQTKYAVWCVILKVGLERTEGWKKGSHERQFAYEAHTTCDQHGWILEVEVTAGNVSGSVAWDAVYDQVPSKFLGAKFIVMDAGYKTPWIANKTLEDSRIPILPYTRYTGRKDKFHPWDFTYDPE